MENSGIRELRIGNYVSTKIGVGHITMIDSVELKVTVTLEDIAYTCSLKDITAIQLAPDLFKKLGFEKKVILTHSLGSYVWWEKSMMKISKTLHGSYCLENYTSPCKTFKSVHKLQNIYWDLKEEDLTLMKNVKSNN